MPPAAPNRLWVADFTYCPTWDGMVYVAFVIDAFSRRITGWRAATTMTTALVLDALEHAVWTRAAPPTRRTVGHEHLYRSAAGGAELTGCVLGALGVPAADRQVRTHPGQAQGGRPADTAAGTGDQHGPAGHRSAVELSHGRARWSAQWSAPHTVMTILPRVLPASSARMASGTSPSG